jgi:flavin reductase (DIM6/NTAB) family NADH-FMN oxidoreductase RutF
LAPAHDLHEPPLSADLTSGPPSGPAHSFDAFVARADHSVVVVTATADGRDDGCLVGFHSQVSIEPRRYLVALSHANATFETASRARQLAVHLLTAEAVSTASLFGEESAGAGVDKLAGCEWHRIDDGPPLLEGVAAWFVGDIVAVHPLGDHTGFVLEPTMAGLGRAEVALHYDQVQHLDAGADTAGGRPSPH